MVVLISKRSDQESLVMHPKIRPIVNNLAVFLASRRGKTFHTELTFLISIVYGTRYISRVSAQKCINKRKVYI